MSMRSKVSKRNEFYISKHRYYELKHFCLQYPEWKKEYLELSSPFKRKYEYDICSGNLSWSDAVGNSAVRKVILSDKMKLVEVTAINTDRELSSYILRAVTQGLSYESLYDIPCCRETFYKRCRKFFYILSLEKG